MRSLIATLSVLSPNMWFSINQHSLYEYIVESLLLKVIDFYFLSILRVYLAFLGHLENLAKLDRV